ncbi:MAG: HIT family protein [Burkholderiaceae bacterium]|nr:HIT family protein [Burkholderiaceae bacterium]
MPADPYCPLCSADGGRVVARGARWRIVLVDDADHPAFTRVIWNAHVAEMSDLEAAARDELLDTVLRVESVQRATLAPDKINLASLGNQVPHLHWHVIPRWRDDRHFPNPVWGAPRDDARGHAALRSAAVRSRLDAYLAALHGAFAEESGSSVAP